MYTSFETHEKSFKNVFNIDQLGYLNTPGHGALGSYITPVTLDLLHKAHVRELTPKELRKGRLSPIHKYFEFS